MVDEADAPDPHLPLEETADESTRWGYVILALLAAVVGAVFAPEGWAPGAGRVTCRWKGEVVAEAPVQVGGAEAVTLEGATNGVRLFVALPAGVPVDKPVRATVRAERGGEPFRPRLDDVRLTLVLSEGSEELVPILKWDGKAQHLDAARRPPVDTAVVLAILGIVIVLWVTEAIPLWVTALIVPIVIVASGMGKAKPALAPFFHPIIALFFGGFMLAQAMHRVGLDRRIATTIVSRAGRSPAMLFAAMLAVSAFLSMWMSNTASTAVLIPIAIAITAPLRHEGYRKAMVLGIAYAATIGGVGSLIGTPANPLAVEFLDTFVGRTITFTEWFAFGLPLVVLFLPVMGIYLWRRSKVNVQK